MYTQAELIVMAKQVASNQSLDPQLVCAVVEQESAWDANAVRLEQGFYVRYIKPMNLPSAMEAVGRSSSFGLMQIMGEVARELKFTGSFDDLCQPTQGLAWGCLHLKNKLAAAKGDVHDALQLWNGGSNPVYAAQVMARMKKYQ